MASSERKKNKRVTIKYRYRSDSGKAGTGATDDVNDGCPGVQLCVQTCSVFHENVLLHCYKKSIYTLLPRSNPSGAHHLNPYFIHDPWM